MVTIVGCETLLALLYFVRNKRAFHFQEGKSETSHPPHFLRGERIVGASGIMTTIASRNAVLLAGGQLKMIPTVDHSFIIYNNKVFSNR